ncbi:MAG: DUF5683 domain-containing protein [Bacteroidales bacterium]|jgi:hypothetical protein|nr:DUF5683 domain-containing protein [Bacteroidales bacterium]
MQDTVGLKIGLLFFICLFLNGILSAQELVDTIAQPPQDSLSVHFIPESDLSIVSDTEVLATTYPLDSIAQSRKPIPAKAAIMSAVLPGLGQIYNRKVWKVPIVYGAIGTATYFFVRYQNDFQQWRRAYIDFNDGDPFTDYHQTLTYPNPNYSEAEKGRYITNQKDRFRKNRDWAILAVVITYFMNVIDANVDAHLFDYNIDDNLSLRIQPCFLENSVNSKKIGVNLCFRF